ncbi:glycosyltransferase [Natronomonas sp. F2-12]|jgi:glycosyltransferase involved in cell wall biosynthesis|uniref:Glycosyltransferase n=1 Tax=Natronomonas aquatica TaxID=2841590 RepID=A0A9R1D5T9_9EURY|nr:glycosyltransferase [Natronomonas aquatica]MCQ4332242.1 glycosyltransferase [Natronomonas aquatica]
MELSVVVPTLNDRDELRGCLDAVAAEAPDEIVVVNGPSTDGTSGMVRDREDVDVLVEIDDRNVNVARNAGIDRARGEAVAFLDPMATAESGWLEAAEGGLSEAGAVTGPTHERLGAGVATDTVEDRTIGGRAVTYFNGGNVAFSRDLLIELDGFDEYLETGGARDLAHRIAGVDSAVVWATGMCVSRETAADGGSTERDWRLRYRSLAYRLAKNYGPHPTVPFRTLRHAVTDAGAAFRDVAHGEAKPSAWFGNGRDVTVGSCRGYVDGLRARYTDRTPSRNPRGVSTRNDRAVAVHDRR